MKLLLALIVLLLLPDIAWAQSTFSPLNLAPPDTDLSKLYLSNMFGYVDGVLAGTGSELLGSLFGVFNSAVLVLGGIIVLYTLLVGTLSTAHEGEVLGKKWSSIWIPLRSVAGIALLIPKASGYSFIQIFMMWVVVQGIGAADSVWNATLDYFSRGGIVIQQSTSAVGSGNADLVNKSATLLRSLVCTDMLQTQFTNAAASGSANAPPNFYQGILAAFNDAGSSGWVNFPTSGYYNTDGVCGQVSWTAASLPSWMLNNNTGEVKPEYVNVKTLIEQNRTVAIQQMVTQLYPIAQSIVDNYMLSYQTPAQTPVLLGQIVSGNIWGAGTLTNPQPYLLPGTVLNDAANAYLASMAATLNAQNMSAPPDADWIQSARTNGWIVAGEYYFSIISLNQGTQNIVESSQALSFQDPGNNLAQNHYITDHLSTSQVAQLNDLVNNSTKDTTVGVGGPFLKGQLTYSSTGNFTTPAAMSSSNIPSEASDIINIFGSTLGNVAGAFHDLISAQGSNTNPVFGIANLGNQLIEWAIWTWITIAISIFAAALIMALAFGLALAVSTISLGIIIMGLLTPILTAILICGFMLQFFFPMIPFIIFTMTAIGWIVAVVEAIIAAPIVALGIAHPEGHEIAGRAEPAIVLMVNVFFRPTFMLFGLLCGMLLSYVSLWLVNLGFFHAYSSFTNAITGSFAPLFTGIFMLIVYVALIQQVVWRSFSLIYQIPDEVLKWISGGNVVGSSAGDVEKAVGAAQGAVNAAGSQVASSIKQVSDATMSGMQKMFSLGGTVPDMGPTASGKDAGGGATGAESGDVSGGDAGGDAAAGLAAVAGGATGVDAGGAVASTGGAGDMGTSGSTDTGTGSGTTSGLGKVKAQLKKGGAYKAFKAVQSALSSDTSSSEPEPGDQSPPEENDGNPPPQS